MIPAVPSMVHANSRPKRAHPLDAVTLWIVGKIPHRLNKESRIALAANFVEPCLAPVQDVVQFGLCWPGEAKDAHAQPFCAFERSDARRFRSSRSERRPSSPFTNRNSPRSIAAIPRLVMVSMAAKLVRSASKSSW